MRRSGIDLLGPEPKIGGEYESVPKRRRGPALLGVDSGSRLWTRFSADPDDGDGTSTAISTTRSRSGRSG